MGKRNLEIRIPVARPALLATWFGLWIHKYFCPLPRKWHNLTNEIYFKAKWSLKPLSGFAAIATLGVAMLALPVLLGRGRLRKSL